MSIYKQGAIIIILLISTPTITNAVIPPDFIFSLSTSIIQVLALMLLIATSIFVSIFQFLHIHKYKIKVISIFLMVFALLTIISFYVWTDHIKTYQQNEYEKWQQESSLHNETFQIEKKVTGSNIIDTLPISIKNDFYGKHKDIPLIITNKELDIVIKTRPYKYIILDARENIEVENGYLPDSIHIRLADLKDGAWSKLPKDTRVYVYCWSGIRGEQTARFLRSKHVIASYLEGGAVSWYDDGGAWIGNIRFVEKYTEQVYKKILSTSQVKKYVRNGAILVDVRKLDNSPSIIDSTVNIPLMHIPSITFAKFFAQVPTHSKVITICDDYTNCFAAKLVGVELEKLGHTFIGRYNKPWEYEE